MLYNKRCFFKEILILVFIVHLILLGLIFVCDTGKFNQERFVIDSNNLQSTVVFMPLAKRVEAQKTSGSSKLQKNGTRKVMSHNEYKKKVAAKNTKPKKIKKAAVDKKKSEAKSVAKPVEKKITPPVVKPEPVKKSPTILQTSMAKPLPDLKKIEADKQKKAAADKAAADKKKIADKKKADAAAAKKALDAKLLADKKKTEADKKAALEKEKKIESQKKLQDEAAAAHKKAEEKKVHDEAKKLAEQKALDKEKVAQQQDIVNKEVVIPKIEPVIIEQQAIEEITVADIAPAAVQESAEHIESDEDVSDEDNLDLENISFVGSRDLEMMQIKEQIQAEIIKYYKPPVGISKKAVCDVSVMVGAGGKATRVTIKKGSGSMANDMCARAALLKVTFPKEVIGKEIIIALGQS